MSGRTKTEKDCKEYKLFKATKGRALWSAITAYALKLHRTEGNEILKFYKHNMKRFYKWKTVRNKKNSHDPESQKARVKRQ